MGNRRRVLGSLKQQMAIADTHMAVNGCQVLMGHPDPARATATAKLFKNQLASVIDRARCVNMSDIYNASIEVQRKLEIGESICN